MGEGVAEMSDSPSGSIDKLKHACIGILVGTIALYCAVAVIKSIWTTLVIIIGVLSFIGLVVVGIAIVRKIRGGW